MPLRSDAARERPGAVPVVSRYRQFPPQRAAAEALACTWDGVPGWARRLRVLPDGCLDLVWDGHQVLAVPARPWPVRYQVGAAGQVTGLRIRPGWGAAVLGTPLGDLDGVTGLDDLWGAHAARGLEAALASAAAPGAPRGVLAAAVMKRLDEGADPDPRVLGAVRLLGQPGVSVREAAGQVHLSVRQLRRGFAGQVGLPPRTLQAILRFQRLRARLATTAGPPATLACAAADCGYFDHAHRCRDCRRLAGLTPTALRQACQAATGDV